MKVVINKCFGGFGLSEKAYYRYAEIKGLTLYPDGDKDSLCGPTYWLVPVSERVKDLSGEAWHKASMEERQAHNAAYAEQVLYDRDIPRTDTALIQVVEELGGEASGRFAALAVVEIPDDIDWEIDDYDGNETIEEAHRSWR